MNDSSGSSYEIVDYTDWSSNEFENLMTNSSLSLYESHQNRVVIKLSSALTQVLNDSNISIRLQNESEYSSLDVLSQEGGTKTTLYDEEITWGRVTGAVFCVLLIMSTIFGNTLVVIVVAKFHRMRSVTNILLARYVSLLSEEFMCLVLHANFSF